MVVEGQLQGAVALGIGSALLEEIAYDEAGQLLAGSYMDYLLPTATDVPTMAIDHLETLSPLNPLGLKGVGESGALPVPAVLASAIEDAVGPARRPRHAHAARARAPARPAAAGPPGVGREPLAAQLAATRARRAPARGFPAGAPDHPERRALVFVTRRSSLASLRRLAARSSVRSPSWLNAVCGRMPSWSAIERAAGTRSSRHRSASCWPSRCLGLELEGSRLVALVRLRARSTARSAPDVAARSLGEQVGVASVRGRRDLCVTWRRRSAW